MLQTSVTRSMPVPGPHGKAGGCGRGSRRAMVGLLYIMQEASMFSHITLGSNDIAASKKFYDATLGALGIAPSDINAKGRLIYTTDHGRLIVTSPVNGQPATAANGGTIGFVAGSEQEVDAWHAAGVANGGVPCEDPPGIRHMPTGDLYLAYLRDPTGNKLCALYRVTA